MRILLLPAALFALGWLGTASAQTADKPEPRCSPAYGTAMAEAGEIQAAYLQAETQGERPEACVRAKLYVRAIRRAATAASASTRDCMPANPGTVIQLLWRDETIWRSKIARMCTASTGATQQHRIIRLAPSGTDAPAD